MTQHEKFINRANELVQVAENFNNDCIGTFDLEALKYFYENMSELFSCIQRSLYLGRRFQQC